MEIYSVEKLLRNNDLNMKKVLFILFVLLSFMPVLGQKRTKHQIAIDRVNFLCDSIKPFYIETESGVEFSRVIQAANYTDKDALYNKCIELMNSAYKDAKEVIQNKDKESGLILGKGLFVSPIWDAWIGYCGYIKIEHIIKVQVKEGRLKVSLNIDNVKLERSGNVSVFPIKAYYPFWTDCPEKKIDKSFNTICFGFINAINILNYFENEIKKSASSNNDDW